MRVLPDSLFGRLLVAIVAVVALTLLVILALIVRERRDFALLGGGAGNSVANIAETVEHLASLERSERTEALAELRAKRRSLEEMRRPPPELIAARKDIERIVVNELQRKLGDGYQVRVLAPGDARRNVLSLNDERPPEPPSEGVPGAPSGAQHGPRGERRPFMLEVTLPDGDALSFRMPMPRPGPPLPRQIFFEFGLLTLVLGIVIYAMTRTITRPLAQLARAADAVGRGASVEPLPERGGLELRAATHAFNAMQERLRRYLDSRTRVLAAMSHDLRTPLTRLRLRVESIEDDELRAKCAADLDEMSNMIRGALAVFRGLNDDEPTGPIDIEHSLSELRDQFTEMGADVTLQGRASQPYSGKPLALKRCVANLVQNAVQYGGSATIAIEDSATSLTIRVRDRGPGIPNDALDKVFEPFFRLEASRNRDTGGTGLGLSIARDIAQAHGGTLALRNAEPGLEAILTLPR